MRLIDLYYQSYKNFTKGIEKPVNKGIPHDSGLSMSRLLYRKGKLFGVFWAAFLGLSVLLIVYTGAVMFIDVSNDVESKYYTLFYIILLLAILVDVVILDALDKSHVKRKYTALYEESIKRAVRFKENLEKDFRFTSLEQYEMLYADATKEYQERQKSINRKRESADKLLWGIIIASVIAIVPSLITGVLDNIDKIESIYSALQIFVQTYILSLIPCIVIHQIIKHSVKNSEDHLWSFSQFTDTIQIIINYENGLLTEKEEPQS